MTPSVLPASALFGGAQSAAPVSTDAAAHARPVNFPAQDAAIVEQVVGAAHSDLAKVRALVDAQPALARATWDWGFGDWESALGAASHMGRRDIADYLIAMGARPDLFSAAMLGQLDVVRAAVTASPGVQRIKGPHGITLLRHAQAGGDAARAVVEYLISVGGADERPALAPLANEDRDRLVGTYSYGAGATDRFEVLVQRDNLAIKRAGAAQRMMFHLGELTFYPAGAEAVRIAFTASGSALTLQVTDGPIRTAARRV